MQLVRRVLGAACLVLTGATVVFADIAPADQAQVTVTVLDQTGAALVIASVTLVDAAGTPITRPVDQRGQATFEKLAPGSYQLKADAVSFQSYDAPLKVKKGANQLTLKLPLAGLNEQVIVTTQDSDVRGNGFVTQLSEQEIAELPDDPDELQQVLEQMAGPGATFRVNGFTGGRLPPKSQIRQIRFRMNSFDAEYHEGGGFGIDIITKPGMDGWKGMTNFGFRDESLNARNAFAPTLAPEQHRRFGFNADGPIVKGKTSMADQPRGQRLVRFRNDQRADAGRTRRGLGPQPREADVRIGAARSFAHQEPADARGVPAQYRRARQPRRRRFRSARSRIPTRDHEQRPTDRDERPDRSRRWRTSSESASNPARRPRRRSRPTRLSSSSTTSRAAAPGRTAIAATRRWRSLTTLTGASARSTHFVPACWPNRYLVQQ